MFKELSKKYLIKICMLLLILGIGLVPATEVQAKAAINKTSVVLEKGKTSQLKVTGTTVKVKWYSSKKSVATVNSKGKVTAIEKGTATITARVGKKKLTCQVMVYRANSGNSKVNKKVHAIIKKEIKANMSTAEKIKAVHDYMVLNCAYDYDNYLHGTIPGTSYSPSGVLLKKKAVCQGYAETFQLFMDALNIPCKIVTGTGNGGGHAWNMVKVDGKWYHIDVTWDDPVPDEKGYVRYKYFLIPDSKMDDDHNWNKSVYKKCKSGSNKFINLFGTPCNNMDQAAEQVYKGYLKDKKKVTLIISKKLYTGTLFDITDRVAEKYNIELNGYSYSRYPYGDYYIYTIDFSY